MNITIADIDNDVALDQAAMASVLGGSGWHNHSTSTSYGRTSYGGWSGWMSTGVPFMKKRFRNLYRTKYIKIRQHRRQWQRRSVFSLAV